MTTTIQYDNRAVTAAMEYAAKGWQVVPLYGLRYDGKTCACHKGENCTSQGKHPILVDWPNQTSCDEDKVAEWIEQFKNCNWGVKLGEQSGILDIECDDEEAEQHVLDLFDNNVPICPTFQSSKGKHRIFRWSSNLPGLAVFRIGKIEIRTGNGGKGAQSVFPPSKHAVSGPREWLPGLSPDDVDPPELPASVVAKLWNMAGEDAAPGDTGNGAVDQNEDVAEPGRNERLTKLVGRWLVTEPILTDQAIARERTRAHKWNSEHAKPPLPADEVNRTFDSILRAEQGKPKRQPAPSDGEPQRPTAYVRTDTGNAERFADQHRRKVLYCHPWKKWLVYDGQRWRLDDTGGVERLAKETARAIYAEAAAEEKEARRKEIVKHARNTEAAARRAAMLHLAQSEVPVLPDELDRDPWLLNCENGTLDLRTGNMRHHHRDDRITKLCPVAYDRTATAPVWSTYLETTFQGNTELVEFMQRLVGYWLTGDVSEHVLPIAYGSGSNGKSVFVETILGVLGEDYAMKAPMDLLIAKQRAHPTELADLHGKRFVACVESEEDHRLAEAAVKELTGGDSVRARRMKEDFWQFRATHKLLLATNHKPIVRGTDHAIWRRLRLVPFTREFIGVEQDKQLSAKLRAEFPGILRWAVEGCLAWQRDQTLGQPAAVQEATNTYRADEDTIERYLDERCVRAPEATTRAGDLFEDFQKWCSRAGVDPIGSRTFGERMIRKGIIKRRSNGIRYVGVGIRSLGEV